MYSEVVTKMPNTLVDTISFVHFRFRSEANRPKPGVTNIKKLLGHCTDVKVAYRLASELGLSDYTRDLVKSDSGAYLKDSLSVQY